MGWSNRFTYEVCPDEIPDLEAVLDAAMAPVEALDRAGACTNCPVETTSDECYGFGEGPIGCVGNEPQVCDRAAAGQVVTCTAPAPANFECDERFGWLRRP